MDIFAELKKRADREIEGLREASAKTDDTNEKYKYRKIRVGIEAMLEHIYEVENEFKVSKAYKNEVITKADKIRSMSDEELAEFLRGIDNGHEITYGDYFHTKDGDLIFSRDDINEKMIQYLQSEAE